jgi:hypothetical protein
MRKITILLMVLMLSFASIYGAETALQFDKDNARKDPGAVHTERYRWVIADETTSTGTEPTDLAVTERTYQLVKAAIATASSGDDEISIFDIPRGWNVIKFKGIGITDGGDYVNQIYLGTLGDGNKDKDSTGADTELVYAGQLEWVIGTQSSIYSQIAYTSGGTRTIVAGDLLTGATSDETATVISITLTSGTFAGGDAAGVITVRSQSGTFQSENLDVTIGGDGDTFLNNATIGADMTRFEVADAVTVTASDVVSSWGSQTPGSNRSANASLDVEGADVMIIVSTIVDVDSKLLVKGY